MSEIETHIGKLKKIHIDSSVEKWCEDMCTYHEIIELDSCKTWEEKLLEEFSEQYVIVNDEIYEIFDHREFRGDDIYHLVKTDDGVYDFVMQFYNGGTYLGECLEDALKK